MTECEDFYLKYLYNSTFKDRKCITCFNGQFKVIRWSEAIKLPGKHLLDSCYINAIGKEGLGIHCTSNKEGVYLDEVTYTTETKNPQSGGYFTECSSYVEAGIIKLIKDSGTSEDLLSIGSKNDNRIVDRAREDNYIIFTKDDHVATLSYNNGASFVILLSSEQFIGKGKYDYSTIKEDFFKKVNYQNEDLNNKLKNI